MELWVYDQTTHAGWRVQREGETITIGREETCDLVLSGMFVARRHARITRDGQHFYLENLSHEGTRVANREVPPGGSTRVAFGDEITLAQYALAILRPEGQRVSRGADPRALQDELLTFEQRVHRQLLERLNLRTTASVNKSDEGHTTQILHELEGLVEGAVHELREPVVRHTVYMHLHRLIVAEVVRQCQGRVETEYRAADERLLDPTHERAIAELVSSVVETMPLIFDPGSVGEDLAIAEEAFEEQFAGTYETLSAELKRYLVQRTVSKDIQDIIFGHGPLQDLLEEPHVSEIMVVGKDRIYAEKNGVVQPTTRSFFSEEILMNVIERILAPVGRRVDQSNPLVDARLPDGSRVNAIIAPLSLVGPCVTIRKFGWIPFTIEDLIERDTLSAECASFLQACVIGKKNVVISGGTGSGKTTLLNTLSAHARPAERIVTIEESAELQLPQPHVVKLEARPANVEGRGAFTIRDLVRNSLRMRPDRIIVGEVRGPEALDMLQAMNTGHDGSLSTLHANGPREALKRLETLVLMAVEMPVRAIREQIAGANDVVVQVDRLASGNRQVTRIAEVGGIDPETEQVQVEDIFYRDPGQERLRHTGYIPSFAESLIDRGYLDMKVFL